MPYFHANEGAEKQDAAKSTNVSTKHFVIRRTTDQPEPPKPRQSPVPLPPALLPLSQKTAASATVERNAKAKEAVKRKQRRPKSRKPKEPVRRGGTKGGDKAHNKVAVDKDFYFGTEELLPKSLPVKKTRDPATTAKLTKRTPSIVKIRKEVRKKKALKPTTSPMSGNASMASSTAAGPSLPSSAVPSTTPIGNPAEKSSSKSQGTAEKSEDHWPPSGHVTSANTTSGPRWCGCLITADLESKGLPGGENWAYFVTSLVVLALAGLVLLLTTLLLQMYVKRAASSVTSSQRAKPASELDSGDTTTSMARSTTYGSSG